MTTDAHSGCPRCILPYKEDSTSLRCSQCGFTKVLDTTSFLKYHIFFQCGRLQYMVLWFQSTTTFTSVTIDNLNRRQDIILNKSEKFRIDHWIPFDITLDQLKLYLTFS